MIEVLNLHKSFGEKKVLKGVNLNCIKGETTFIIGASGGGKSVLVKHFIGLIKPDQGSIKIDGHELTKMNSFELKNIRKNFGYLFQDAALFDSMTVYENVSFPLKEHTKYKESKIKDIVRQKLDLVGLKGIDHNYPSELSGGMRKRVGLARAIVLEPQIILYDEPTTGLDPIMSDAIDDLIVNTKKELNVTSIVISHDIASTFKIADKIAMLYDGRIIETGTPAQILKSDLKPVKEFLARSRL
ncbi:MAG: ABC transporter ATP-binding protein [Pseudomonadota bacterium]